MKKATVLPDSAEQMLFGVHFALTENGVNHGDVKADTAYMYDEGTRTELRQVNTTFFTTEGVKNGILTSLRGTYHGRVGSMEARGNVVVITTDSRKLETPQLRYDPTRNEISSDSAFTLTTPDHGVTQGVGFVSDPNMRNVRVLKGLKTSGQSVAVPKR